MKLSPQVLGLELTPAGWRAVHLRSGFLKVRILGCAEGPVEGPLPEALDGVLRGAVASLDVQPGARLGIALARPLAHVKAVAVTRAPRAAVLRTIEEQAGSFFPTGAAPVAVDVCFLGRNGARRARELKGLVAVSTQELSDSLETAAGRLKLELRSADLSASAVQRLVPSGTDSLVLGHRVGLEWVHYEKHGRLAWSRYFPTPSNGAPAGSPDAHDRSSLPEVLARQMGIRAAILIDGVVHGPHGDGDEVNAGGGTLGLPPPRGLSHWRFAAAYGAGLQALGGRTGFDLRSTRLKEKKRVVRYRRRGALLALVVLGAAFHLLGGLFQLGAEVRQLELAIEELRPLTEKVVDLRATLQATSERADQVNALEAAQPRWTHTLAEIGRVLPPSAYLVGLTADGESIRIEGYAAGTPTVIGALQASEMFRSVRLSGPVTRESTPLGERQKFTIELSLAQRLGEGR